MATVETKPNRFSPMLSRAKEWVRDSVRGYSDQDLQNHLTAAIGNISADYRESYQKRQLDRAYFLGGGINSIMMSADPTYTIPPDMEPAVESLHQESDRIRSLTPEQLDDEIVRDANSWLKDHDFPIPH